MQGRSRQSRESRLTGIRRWAVQAAHRRALATGAPCSPDVRPGARAPKARRAASPSGAGAHAYVQLWLLQRCAGWSLVSPDGESVFQAEGAEARSRCLEFAHAEGVLAILS
jgi:hypothetical protein